MSTTIDERVVSLQFDNSKFEKNVSTTMSTLDKLKQSLRFNGASKGLTDINSAVGKVNMSGLGAAVETVSAKFSAMQVIGVTALANITNSAVNAGKRMVKALTIDPVTTGFKEYETQINATQTIMANVANKGKTLDDVNAALEELNKYADQTIYNFTEMTKNIGLFTNAGVGLDESVSSIKGFSNAAAMAGTDATRTAGAMYQLSQAMSSGAVRLMDWRSLEQANITGQRFQDTIKITARAHGIAIDDMIAKEGSLRDTLSSGWLTADLMAEALQHYTLSTETMTEAEQEAVKVKMRSNGYTEEQIDALFELGTEATNAATKIKTFTQLWEVLKESAQSGWSKTWRLIVGDFEQAKGLLTPLGAALTSFIDKMSYVRNRVIEIALGFSKPWKDMTDKLGNVKKAVDGITKVTDTLEYFQDVVNKVWMGDYKNSDTGRFELLRQAGYNDDVVQDLVNKGYQYKLTMEDVEESHKKFGITLENTTDEAKDTTIAFEKLSDKKLKDAGLTEEEISLYRAMEKEADRLGISVSELADEMSKTDGRTLLIDAFKNFGDIFVGIGKAAKESWNEIVNPPSLEQLGIRLYGVIKTIKDFSETLRLTDKETGEFTETGKKILRTFKGLFAIIDMVTTVLGGGFKIAFKVISSILSYFNLDILDVTANIGDAIVKFHDWFDSLFDISGILDKIVPLIEGAIEAIKGWTGAVKESEAFQVASDIVDGLINGLTTRATEVWEAAVGMVEDLVQKVKDFLGIHSPSTVFAAIGGFIIAGLVLGLQNGIPDSLGAIKDVFDPMLEWVRGLDFGAIVAGLVGIGTVKAAGTAANALDKISSPMEGVGEFLENTAVMVKKVTKPVKNVIKGVAKIEKAVAFNISMEGVKTLAISLLMLVGAVAILTLCDTKKLWNAVGVVSVLAAVLVALSFAMSKIGSASASFNLKDGLNIQGLTMGLVGIGAAILLIAAAVKMIGKLEPDQIKQGFLGLAGAVVAIGLVLAAFSILNVGSGKAAENIGKLGGTLVKLSIALLLMAAVVKISAKLTDTELIAGAKFVAGFLAFLLLINLIALIPSKGIDKIGGMMLKLSLALLLMVGTVKLIAKLSPEEMIAGAQFLIVFVGFIGILAAIGGLGGKAIDGVGKMMLSLSVALLLMIAAVKLIAEMTPGDLIKGAAVIGGFTIIIALLVKSVMKHQGEAPKVALTILAFSVAIAILAAVAIVCGMISVEGLAKGIIAVGLLSLMMMGLVAATRGASNVTSTVIALAATIGILVVAVAVLGMMDPVKLATGVGAVTILLGMLTLLIKVAGTAQKAMGTVIAIAGVLLLVGGVLYILATLPVESVIGSAIGLSVLLLSLSGVIAILSTVGPAASQAYPAMLALAALIGGLMLVLLALGGLSKIEGFNELLADGGATLALIGTALGAFVGSIVKGFASEVLQILPMFGVALSGFMIGVTPFIAGLKMVDASVLEGAGVLAAAILALTVADLIAGIASLGGIGLIGLGLQLSGFISAAMPFILTAAKIKPEMVEGVKALAETILIITAADLLAGLTAFITGGSSLESFATQLPKLGEGLSKFSTSLGEFTESQLDTVNCAAKAIKTLAQAANEIPNTGGLLGDLIGNNDLGPFAEQFPVLGSGLRGFLDNIGEFTDAQVATVTSAAEAIKTLAQAANEIPNTGGLLGDLIGNNDLGPFAEQFPVLATGLRGFIDNVGTLNETTAATVTAGADAVAALAKASKNIPNEGGWLGKIIGDNNLGDFAENFPVLGTGLRGFVDNIGEFSDSQVSAVTSAVHAVNALTGLANADLSSATTYLPTFGDNLVYLASDLTTFCSDMPTYSTVTLACMSITTLLDSVKDIGDANTGVLSTFANNLKKISKNAVSKFIEAFTDESAKKDVKDAASKLAGKAVDGAKDKTESMRTAGNDLGDGLINGINDKKSAVYWAGYALGQQAVQGEKDGQQSNSPSKATIKAGKWLGEGLVIGIGEMSRKVYNAGSDIGKTATKSISSSVSKIASAINTDIDAQPTIRPVLDLSDVRSGVSSIGSMFSGSNSIGVNANVSAISSMMNSRSQNGTTDDVISAINKLRKDLGNVGNTTYSINGVTYDDGSNIAEAVKIITRAAVRERRV